jgi:hypothetical protein
VTPTVKQRLSGCRNQGLAADSKDLRGPVPVLVS